jgi:hypothetical protein
MNSVLWTALDIMGFIEIQCVFEDWQCGFKYDYVQIMSLGQYDFGLF